MEAIAPIDTCHHCLVGSGQDCPRILCTPYSVFMYWQVGNRTKASFFSI